MSPGRPLACEVKRTTQTHPLLLMRTLVGHQYCPRVHQNSEYFDAEQIILWRGRTLLDSPSMITFHVENTQSMVKHCEIEHHIPNHDLGGQYNPLRQRGYDRPRLGCVRCRRLARL